jgi:hypothetical protein
MRVIKKPDAKYKRIRLFIILTNSKRLKLISNLQETAYILFLISDFPAYYGHEVF